MNNRFVPIRLTDAGLSRFQAHLGSSLQISEKEFSNLLTEIVDPTGLPAFKESFAKEPRDEQLKIIRAALGPEEEAGVKTLLDESGLQFSEQARNFLEALIGRQRLSRQLPLSVKGASASGISGTSAPNTVIEAINLSTHAATPGGRIIDTLDAGRSDSSGRFAFTMPETRAGDHIRLRARGTDGSVSDWFTAHVEGATDDRAAYLEPRRVMIRNPGTGTVELLNVSAELALSEPYANVKIINTRTGSTASARLDETGHLPAGFSIGANAGDRLSIAVSDGAGNTNFSATSGSLTVPNAVTGNIDDPLPAETDRLGLIRPPGGKLFIGGISASDVQQGSLGNCYVPAAAAAIAATNPDLIRDLIRDNGDGTYTVRFFDSNSGEPSVIVVDSDVYGRAGSLAYGHSPDQNELWFALVEKAYATWKGSYQRIGEGGSVGTLLSEMTGRRTYEHWLNRGTAEDAWVQLKRGVREKRPMSAGTYGTNSAAIYTNTGVHSNHAYSVMGIDEVNGQRMVKLRNPWGGGTGFSGEFSLPFEQFTHLFLVLNVN